MPLYTRLLFQYLICFSQKKLKYLHQYIIYGGIMNPASILMSYGYITKSSLIAYYISGAPVDLVHAASTVIFLWLLSRPLLEKLERIKVKYGLIQESENR